MCAIMCTALCDRMGSRDLMHAGPSVPAQCLVLFDASYLALIPRPEVGGARQFRSTPTLKR